MNELQYSNDRSVFSNHVLDQAYDWLCQRRREYPADDGVWTLRANWVNEKSRIVVDLRSGNYQFLPQQRIITSDGEIADLWAARDALVLKALTIVLSGILPISADCCHIKGNGGLKRAIRDVNAHIPDNRFVFRTDVKSYYASIDHIALLDRLAVYVRDKNLINLVGRYLKRSTEYGGTFQDFEQGISRGCPLSPLIGAFYLNELDQELAKQPVFYIRYMDDIVILAKTRWKLRRAIASVNRVLQSLHLEKHPDKTFIGPVSKGFDFLGYHFCRKGLSLAHTTVRKFLTKLSRLYEHNGRKQKRYQDWSPKRQTPQCVETIITTYINRWLGWVYGGLNNVQVRVLGDHGCRCSAHLLAVQ